MFKLFKKQSKAEKLNKQYENLLREAHRLSTVNRKASDSKMADAEKIAREIESLQSV